MSVAMTGCPKCNGKMVQGFIVDHQGDLMSRVDNWVEGPAEKSYWFKTKVPTDKCIPVGTFRCSSCGFLESYARSEFAAR